MFGLKPNDPHTPEDNRRIAVAIALSLVVLLGYHFFYVKPHEEMRHKIEAAQALKAPPEAPKGAVPGAASSADKAEAGKPVARDAALKESDRIPIEGKRLIGSLPVKGGRFDDIRLVGYDASREDATPVALLSPAGTSQAYYVDGGWLSSDSTAELPKADTVWTPAPDSASKLESSGKPVILTWDNGHGLKFERRIAMDDNYLFTITQRVTNTGDKDVPLNAYHTTSRDALPPDFRGFYALHEGPIGRLNHKTIDPQYKSVAEGVGYDLQDQQGWYGITDRYWLVAMLPDPQQHFNMTLKGQNFHKPDQHYQADLVDTTVTVKAGGSVEEKSYLYAGAKDLKAIQTYQEGYGFDNLELSFDFGIYYIVTKPFYYLLHFLIHSTGNVGFAMLLLTLVVRGAMFPIASKGFRSMAKMRIVGPMMKELQDKYKDDKVTLQQEVFELYKRHDVNPFSGCLPMFVQIPVFFGLYKVIMLAVELRQAPFWGWIRDLSQPDPTTIFNLFGLVHWVPPFSISLGAWPCIYCITMLLQKRISPPMPDAAQERMQTYFPYLFSFMMAQFPVGLVIYYSWSNLLGVLQQYYILKKVGGQDTSLIRGHADRRKKKSKAGDEDDKGSNGSGGKKATPQKDDDAPTLGENSQRAPS